jgi:hypothetical protein
MIWRRNFIRAPYRTAAGSLFDCCQISRRYRYGPSTTNDLLLPLFFFSLFLSGVVLYNIEKKRKTLTKRVDIQPKPQIKKVCCARWL